MKRVLFIVVCLLLVSCSPFRHFTPEELAASPCGDPPTDPTEIVKKYIDKAFFDPWSAHFEVTGTPQRVSLPGHFNGTRAQPMCAWEIKYRVNGKNKFGGYIGWKNESIYYRDGKLQPYVFGEVMEL